jgi:hypothetical protein
LEPLPPTAAAEAEETAEESLWSGARQLQQALVLARVGPSAALAAALAAARTDGRAAPPEPSGFHREVAGALAALGIPHESEVPPARPRPRRAR